jgi:5-amino-6-(5-phosphoribosylamino)uracil reductase
MADLPYTVLSCAVSLDGYLDDASAERLRLSSADDFDRVDQLRAASDAILVGAATVRADDPRLLVRDPGRVRARLSRGLGPTPVKVTLTESVKLDPGAAFFAAGDVEKLVYCPSDRADEARALLGGVATVVDAGQPLGLRRLVEDLRARGIRRLMVEGGATVHTQFLTAGLGDELRLGVAPLFVGDSRARRWVDDGDYPWRPGRRARLLETRPVGDVVLLRYALSDRCEAS